MAQSVAEHEIIPILRPDNKGWKVDIFEDVSTVSHLLCEDCQAVCCDAVELGCKHDQNAYKLYCHQCLDDIIIQNNQQCPIDGHDDPHTNASRSSQRQVLESRVLCPYSAAYQSRVKHPNNELQHAENEGAETMEGAHGDDEENKEGQPMDVEMRMMAAHCQWRGTLSDLIHQHLELCMKQNDHAYVQKLENLVKKLEDENQTLKEKNVALRRKQIEIKKKHKEETKRLTARIGALADELNLCQAKSASMRSSEYEWKGKKEEKENDDVEWIISENERMKYDVKFYQMHLVDGKADADQLRSVMLTSFLAEHKLKRIWELADIDQDGCMDRDEFALCMYLMELTKSGNINLANELPLHLVPPSKRHLM